MGDELRKLRKPVGWRRARTSAERAEKTGNLEVGPRPQKSLKWGTGEEEVPSGARAGVRSLKWGTGSENLGSGEPDLGSGHDV